MCIQSPCLILEFSDNTRLLTDIQAKSTRKFSDTASNRFTSMGIYLIKSDIMRGLLEQHFPKANDFRSEVIPGAISTGMKVKLG